MKPSSFLEECKNLKYPADLLDVDHDFLLPKYNQNNLENRKIPTLAFKKFKYNQEKNFISPRKDLHQNSTFDLVFTISFYHSRSKKMQAQIEFLGSHTLQNVRDSFV